MAKRNKSVKRINLSDHTLDINIRKCDYEKFDFFEVEDFVRELTGTREYQFNAIKNVMIYLWGGEYKNIIQLAKENFKKKEAIKERFQSQENFLRHLPLPDRLSGVVHMATGTGKSYVMFAIAYLSIVMGKVKRVLVLGPPSTVIEQGLMGKFKEYLYGEKGLQLQKKLPSKYRNVPVNLLNENSPIVDNSIVIENINAVWNKDRNSIGDTLFSQTDEILVLSDEVHHAYSHLTFRGDVLEVEEINSSKSTRESESKKERLWMKFIREEPKISRHIGFTGTPYNQDEYFCDVIYDYSINDAMNDRVIKKINPIIKTEAEDGEEKLNINQKFEQILITHYENKEKYSYRDENGKPRLKPITIFINAKQKTAEKNADLFTKVLADYLKATQEEYSNLPASQVYQIASEKVICVISKPTDKDYQEKLDAIEEVNPDKPGGKVEFVFAVNKLSEGWDVDNVYQIVPMEERVFNSKLLISQVLGRGLRLPRKVPFGKILGNYPVVTITNHEKFAEHIKELLYAVTNCETRFISKIFKDKNHKRAKYNFHLFNLNYMPKVELREAKALKQNMQKRELILTPTPEKLHLNVTYMIDKKKFALSRNFYTVDQIVLEIADRFAMRQFEKKHFDFGDGIIVDDLPDRNDIEKVVRKAMEKAGIKGNKLSEENKKQVDLFFNQFLPRGSKKRVYVNVEGDIFGIKTMDMSMASVRVSELDRNTSVFISEDYEEELSDENRFVIKELENQTKKNKEAQIVLDFAGQEQSKYIRPLLEVKPLYVVNTSMFKTPLNLVIVSHGPERDFVFQLIEHSKYIDAWIKSRDKGFYSISYEFWKGGKDRVRRSFNPDFFIKIDLDKYIDVLIENNPELDLTNLRKMQDEGIREIIKVVEIKSDDDKEEVTRAKERYAKEHFDRLNKRLREVNAIDFSDDFSKSINQYYTFDLIRPENYKNWFNGLKVGRII